MKTFQILFAAFVSILACIGSAPAMHAQNTVRAVGDNEYGQLGQTPNRAHVIPVASFGTTYTTAVAAGHNHTVALRSDGRVFAWGDNGLGQLGDSGFQTHISAVGVINGFNVAAIACGNSFSLALKRDGTVWSWGYNNVGQLGNIPDQLSTIAYQVTGLPNIVAISCGENFALALGSDGAVWSWGANDAGQLGDGALGNRRVPMKIPGLSNVTAIAAGLYHSLALKNDGTVWAWGYNGYGEIGDGTTVQQSVPVQVLNLTDVAAISAGAYHSLALKKDGSLAAWGSNTYGQVGDDAVGVDRHTPVPIDLSVSRGPIRAIACGGFHSLALDSLGNVYAWGQNSFGQLGDNTLTNRAVPGQMLYTGHARAIAGGYQYTVLTAPDPEPDFNLDLNHDLLWQNTRTGDVTTWFLHPAASPLPPYPIWGSRSAYLGMGVPLSWKIVGTGDFNLDGSTDLIWQDTETGDVSIWLMNGVQRDSGGYLAHNIPLEWKIVGVADFNQDGKPDLVWQNTQTGDVVVWYMDALVWTGNWDYLGRGVPTEWRIAGTADLNGDNMPDLVWTNSQTGDVTYWLMNGTQRLSSGYIAHNIPLDWTLASIQDLNFDLNPDFVWQNKNTGDVTVWIMSGTDWYGATVLLGQSVPTDWKIAPAH